MTSRPIDARRKFALQFNLGSLLLITALCGSAMSYYLARSNRVRLTSKMNSLAELEGLPPIPDVTTYRFHAANKSDASADVWVPRNGHLQLCWTTSVFDERLPQEYESVMLNEGRHIVTVRSLVDETTLEVDSVVIFRREHTQTWNLSHDTGWDLKGDHELTVPRTVVLLGYGVATLRSDEAYDAKKHRFGLKLWLEK